jgi:hypothetical protein
MPIGSEGHNNRGKPWLTISECIKETGNVARGQEGGDIASLKPYQRSIPDRSQTRLKNAKYIKVFRQKTGRAFWWGDSHTSDPGELSCHILWP